MVNRKALYDNIPVEIYDEQHHKVGEENSIYKASRKCFIQRPKNIWNYLYKKSELRRSRGIKSTTGKRFHFKLKSV